MTRSWQSVHGLESAMDGGWMADSRVGLAEHKHGAVGEDGAHVGLTQVVQDPLLLCHWHGLTVYTVHCDQRQISPWKYKTHVVRYSTSSRNMV